MESKEFLQVIVGVLILFVVIGLRSAVLGNLEILMQSFVFAFVIITVHVFSKKYMGHLLDSDVEHSIWHVYRYGIKPKQHFKRPQSFGLIFPLLISAFTLGVVKVPTLLTYETKALKHRAAKRHGFYSYSEMTDWHIGLIGASGIAGVLVVSLAGYLIGLEYLFKVAAYYAFFNMIPISNLDGTQIFFGNRVMWAVLAFISLLFVLFALIVVT